MAAPKAIRFGAQLKELRIHLCQRSAASQGVREFIETSYVPIKTANPKTPILVRECSGIQPKLWARFEYGREMSVSLTDMKATQVEDQIKIMVSSPV